MKNVVWDEGNMPTFQVADDELQVLDFPQLYDFEVGDQVQFFVEDHRCFVYRVTGVFPECPEEPDEDLKNVTLTRVA